jgi:hypothetical protein
MQLPPAYTVSWGDLLLWDSDPELLAAENVTVESHAYATSQAIVCSDEACGGCGNYHF